MSEPKFTKGPWTRSNKVITGSDGTRVAVISGFDTTGLNAQEIREAFDVLGANAALISAAPEMFEALQDIRSDIEYVANIWQIPPEKFLALEKLDAALSKAVGV